jgi:hypothetical protein
LGSSQNLYANDSGTISRLDFAFKVGKNSEMPANRCDYCASAGVAGLLEFETVKMIYP